MVIQPKVEKSGPIRKRMHSADDVKWPSRHAKNALPFIDLKKVDKQPQKIKGEADSSDTNSSKVKQLQEDSLESSESLASSYDAEIAYSHEKD